MKQILIALTLFSMAAVCLVALSSSANHSKQALQAIQTDWLTRTQQLAEIRAEKELIEAEISDRKINQPGSHAASGIDPELSKFLLTKDIKSASPKMQNRLLASFGPGEKSSGRYVLVGKAALQGANLNPLKKFPDSEKLTDQVRGVLAITPDEQQAVESAFAGAFEAIGNFAREKVQREGPTNEMLVQFTIPADRAFREKMTANLFSSISSVIGNERGELLRKIFEIYGLYEDGAVGDRTNVLSLHRITAAPGFGQRSGWKWANGSEAVNTDPEPIKLDRFPCAFRFIFPGGWEELAEHEGIELPKEFLGK